MTPSARRQLLPNNIASALLVVLAVSVSMVLLSTQYYMFALAIPLGVIILYLFSKYPKYALYIIIFLIPFGAFRKIAGVNVPWVIAALLIGIVFLAITTRQMSARPLTRDFVGLLGLFIVANIVSTLLSPYPDVAKKDLVLWISAYSFIFLSTLLMTKEDLSGLIPTVLITSVTLSAGLAVTGFFFDVSLFAEAQISGAYSRGTGGAIDPNNLSLMIIAILPFIVHRFIFTNNAIIKCFMLAAFLINLLAVFSSYSRGGLIILCCALLLLVFEYRRNIQIKHLFMLCLSAVLIALTLVALMPQSFVDRQSSLSEWEDKSLNRRASYLVVAKDSFLEKPLFGFGPDTFKEQYNKSSYAKRFEKEGKTNRRQAHNTYAEILVGSGIVGLMLFLMILFVAYRNLRSVKQKFLAKGQTKEAYLFGAYALFLVNTLLYLCIFSETHHKFLLVAIPVAHLAHYFYIRTPKELNA